MALPVLSNNNLTDLILELSKITKSLLYKKLRTSVSEHAQGNPLNFNIPLSLGTSGAIYETLCLAS